MISRIKDKKISKKKVKSKRSVKSKINRKNPESSFNELIKLLDRRGEKAAAISSPNWIHYDSLANELKDADLSMGYDPSKAELLKYLRTKKEILENIITDFIRLD